MARGSGDSSRTNPESRSNRCRPSEPGEAGRGDLQNTTRLFGSSATISRPTLDLCQRPTRQGKLVEAIAEYGDVVRLKPDNSRKPIMALAISS